MPHASWVMKMNREKAKYNQNLITGKIRRLLKKNPDAGYEELKKLFNREPDHSLRVTFYKIHKEMFGDCGSLRRTIKKPAPIRDKVTAYFMKHPDHTVSEAAKALQLRQKCVYAVIYNARRIGNLIPFKKRICGMPDTSIAKDIREYMAAHPGITSRECANALGVQTDYVSLIRYREKKRCIS